MRRRSALLLVAALAVGACGGDGSDGATGTTTGDPSASTTAPPTTAPPPDLAAVAISVNEIAQLESATAMAVRSGEDALYVTEQDGRVRRIKIEESDKGRITYELERSAVLDISDDVTAGGEQGLLGITFSTDGRRMYVAYTNENGDAQLVDEFRMDDDKVDERSRRRIFEVPDFAPNHNGGDLHFGPDGFLYYAMGDGGGGGDQSETGQDPSDLLGSLLRVDPEGGDPYGIPGGNPFADGGGAPEVYAYGLRNPWRFSFDRDTGDLWIGDVGQGQYEEIDFLPASDDAGNGVNLGWNAREGAHVFDDSDRPSDAVDPLFEHSHDEGLCAIIGGYVYRGTRIPELEGVYVYSDSCDGTIRGLRQEGGAVVAAGPLGAEVGGPSSFGEGPDGELFVLGLSGTVYTVDPA